MTSSKFISCFNRDRDFYQVPISLKEAGLLDILVTDFYCSENSFNEFIARLFSLQHRHSPLLPASFVLSDFSSFLYNCALRFGFQTNLLYSFIDKSISLRTLQRLKSTKSNLLLYSGYALDSFRYSASCMNSGSLRYLFVYHPAGDYVRSIYENDLSIYPEMYRSYDNEVFRIQSLESASLNEEVSLANGILAASTFTASSVEQYINADCKLSVVPYGPGNINTSFIPFDLKYNISRPRLLFVGQGTQRKGIHHLLKLWSLKYFKSCSLSLVLNNVDPYIDSTLASLPGEVRIYSKLSNSDLLRIYDHSDVFILPSLCEGFGFVYLEALTRGCLLVGTSNTCLPDLDLPSYVSQVSTPSDLSSLENSIDNLLSHLQSNNLSRKLVARLSDRFSWQRFRQGISDFCMN